MSGEISLVNPMRKVYCKNCKCLGRGDDFSCEVRNINKAIGLRFSSWHLPQEKNKNNDCKDYIRKWWKFWI